jgi:endonuclease/exonuclease/phosphatase family metal-dependent hydrolase
MSWNILFGNRQADDIPRFLAAEPADVIALQELRAEHVEALSSDQALRRAYPHRVIWGYGVGGGMGLLSRYPILEHGRLDVPPVLWARLDLGAGRTVVLVSAHPTFGPTKMVEEPPRPRPSAIVRMWQMLDVRFLWYDPEHRDDGIARIRALVDPMLRKGETLLLVGDFNVTERERAYRVLTAGLQDVHLAVGAGSGHTWRPEWMAHLPLPLLRIDYMLSTRNIRPRRMWVDRTLRGSDHFPIHGIFELLPGWNDLLDRNRTP